MGDDYKTVNFPKTRVATLDMGDLSQVRNRVMGFLELDVTNARRMIRELRGKSGRQLSFTAWLIKTISATLEEYPIAAAYLCGKSKAIIFDQIDIAMMVEREVEGYYVPLPYVLRDAAQKDFFAITEEIDKAKNQPLDKSTVIGQRQNRLAADLYYALPGFLRKAIWKYYFLRPKVSKRTMGNVSITSVGMMGNQSGWFISSSIHPLAFGVGSITRKPGVIGNKIEIREILHLSIALDHDVIDGADMARFINSLSRNIGGGMGLE